MRTKLHLFLDWGITFGEPYQTPEHGQRKVYYAGREELENAIIQQFWAEPEPNVPQKGRLPQRGRPLQKAREHSRHEEQIDQPLVTASNFVKRPDAPPASERG